MKQIIELEKFQASGEFYDEETLDPNNWYEALTVLRHLLDELKKRIAELESQVPKMVQIRYGTDYSIDENGECYRCPSCGCDTIWYYVGGQGDGFCHNCGSRIVWIYPVKESNERD